MGAPGSAARVVTVARTSEECMPIVSAAVVAAMRREKPRPRYGLARREASD
jgi:hypothetical protein